MLPSSLYCTTCGAMNKVDTQRCFACQASLLITQPSMPTHLANNTLFHDRYFILNQIGIGGFGSVYKATDTHSSVHFVAIKEVSLQGLTQQAQIEATDTFHREVALLSQLHHPNLPRLYEHFVDSEHLYMVMDFIEGDTLEEYLHKAENRCLLLSEVLAIGLQLCTVLDYLHSQEPAIIFRDLKPANIMRTPQGQIYLIDFGIARYFKPGQRKDTIALGSLGYAAPEQYGKAQTTIRADIYSLGAVLHQLLTGNDPSVAPFQFAPLRVDSLLSLSNLTMLIERMVDGDVNKRPTSAAVVKQELQQIANVWSAVNMRFWQQRPYHTHAYRRQTAKS